MECYPEVVQVVAGEDFSVYAYFSDGTIRLFDVRPLIRRGGIFTQLSDPSFFTDRLTVMNKTVAWDVAGNRDETRCIDLDPFSVYENSLPVADPLEEVA